MTKVYTIRRKANVGFSDSGHAEIKNLDSGSFRYAPLEKHVFAYIAAGCLMGSHAPVDDFFEHFVKFAGFMHIQIKPGIENAVNEALRYLKGEGLILKIEK